MIRAGVVGVFCAVITVAGVPHSAAAQTVDDLRARAQAERARGDFSAAISTLRQVIADAAATVRDRLMLAEILGWAKEFPEAERIYRQVADGQPELVEARLGLARVVLWQGRYAEARQHFASVLSRDSRNVEALEGKATSEYWRGDFRSAERGFESVVRIEPGRTFSVKSLAEIASATRPVDRLVGEVSRDDQPFENRRAELSTSLFTDPLTRWDFKAGSYSLYSPDEESTRTAPYVLISNATTLPWHRITVTPSIGAIRYPDGATLPIGGLSLQLRLERGGTITLAAAQRELLTNLADLYRYSRHYDLTWQRHADRSWLAAAHIGRVTYADGNEGTQADSYALIPVRRRTRYAIYAGASGAWRDTSQPRFFPVVVQSTRDATFPSLFAYSYQGRYIPYFTPQRLREARGILAWEGALPRLTARVQVDGGRARDEGQAFGPSLGISPLPNQIFTFSFPRTYTPWRVRMAVNAPLRRGYSVEAAFEHSDTIQYKANTVHAALARRR